MGTARQTSNPRVSDVPRQHIAPGEGSVGHSVPGVEVEEKRGGRDRRGGRVGGHVCTYVRMYDGIIAGPLRSRSLFVVDALAMAPVGSSPPLLLLLLPR
jgi:hypothetical protein